MGARPIVFMKNHGVVVTGATVAQAYRRIYRLERVCRNQLRQRFPVTDAALLAKTARAMDTAQHAYRKKHNCAPRGD